MIKLELLTFFFLVSSCLFKLEAQTPFELRGNIDGMENGKIQLIELMPDAFNQIEQKTVTFSNGKFVFRGKIANPMKVRFRLNDTLLSNYVFMDGASQYLNIKSADFKNIAFKNSSINAEFDHFKTYMQAYEQKIDHWYDTYWKVEEKYNKAIPPTIEDSLQSVYGGVVKQQDSALLKYIIKYPTSQVALWHLHYKLYHNGYTVLSQRTFASLSQASQRSLRGVEVKRILDAGKLTALGAPFPNINLLDRSGKRRKFKISSETYTLVDFWFSYCAPCIAQFPDIKATYKKYGGKRFTIIGVSIDKKDDRLKWNAAIVKHQLPWKQFWDIGGQEAKSLNINTYPSNFLLDKHGLIIKKDITPHDLNKFLEGIL